MDLYPLFERMAPADKAGTNLEKLNRSDRIGPRDPVSDNEKKKREPGHEQKESRDDEAGGHMEILKNAADMANKEFEEKKIPYRFYIFQELDETYVNLVRLDAEGNVVEARKKNITHEEFTELINHIQKGEGLFFDSAG
jgi:hypothetical protein